MQEQDMNSCPDPRLQDPGDSSPEINIKWTKVGDTLGACQKQGQIFL